MTRKSVFATKVLHVLLHQGCLSLRLIVACLYRFDYIVELLNSFERMDAMLITQEALIGKNIDCIDNIVCLFFTSY